MLLTILTLKMAAAVAVGIVIGVVVARAFRKEEKQDLTDLGVIGTLRNSDFEKGSWQEYGCVRLLNEDGNIEVWPFTKKERARINERAATTVKSELETQGWL